MSATLKAIVITKQNREKLAMQYERHDDPYEGYEGLILVADFGENAQPLGMLNQTAFDKSFERTGKDLQNGYFEVIDKRRARVDTGADILG